MTGGEIFLLALGPAVALVAGLLIYGVGVRAPAPRGAARMRRAERG